MKNESSRFLRLAVVVALVVVVMSVAGDERGSVRVERLMAYTPYYTDVYILDSGRPGNNVLVLAGVHGNEPGTWLAAEKLIKLGAPERGRLVVIPKANRQAVELEVRSTPELGDLNRLYFGDPEAFPMAAVAREIVEVVRRHDVDVVLDMHESWGFHDPASGEVDLAALGQTISPHLSERSRSIATLLVETANRQLSWRERFRYHEFPAGHVDALITALPPGIPESEVPRKSGMDIPEALPGVASILVEVGQQQPLERRVEQHVRVAESLLALLDGELAWDATVRRDVRP